MTDIELGNPPSYESLPSYHNIALAPELAAAVNANFRLVVVGGVHGLPKSTNPGTPTLRDYVYDLTDRLVSTLDSSKGDTLLMEGEGYRGLPDSSYARLLGFASVQKYLEAARKVQEIDTFHYAAIRAEARGVRVLYADIHRDVMKAFLAAEGVKTFAELNPEQRARYHALRNVQAVGTVKDTTLAHLEEAKLQAEKPTYLQLIGDYHVVPEGTVDVGQQVSALYARMGLEVTVISVTQLAQVAAAFSGAAGALGRALGFDTGPQGPYTDS